MIDVPLRIDVPAGLSGSYPVRFGVPFERGSVQEADLQQAAVELGGALVPTQLQPLAWWPDGGGVRFALVDFVAEVQGDEGDAPARLVTGAGGDSALPVTMEESAQGLVVDTGAARFVLPLAGELGFESVEIGGIERLSSTEPARFELLMNGATQTARVEPAEAGGSPFTIEGSPGPLRLGLRFEAAYRPAEGASEAEPRARCIVRFEFVAGSARVRILHTFLFLGEAEFERIQGPRFRVAMEVADAPRARFGTSAADLAQEITIGESDPKANDLYLVQDRHRHSRFRFRLFEYSQQEELLHSAAEDAQDKTAGRAGGWMSLGGEFAGVTLALREGWQNHPFSFQVSSGRMAWAGFWPLGWHAFADETRFRPLDYWTPSVLAVHGLEGLQRIDDFFRFQAPKGGPEDEGNLSEGFDFRRSIFSVPNSATGVAKTHELWVEFHDSFPSAENSVQLARLANEPVLGRAESGWACATGALGPIHPAGDPQHAEVDAALEAMFDRFVHWRDEYVDYGWFDYMDVHDRAAERSLLPVEGGSISSPWRHWGSAHYGFPNAPWILYFRSGERRFLEVAEANSRHCMDLDRCHWGELRGTHFDTNYSIVHWNEAERRLNDYIQLEFLPYYYALRGEFRALEVMRDYARAMVEKVPGYQLPALNFAKNFENLRHFGPPLGNLALLRDWGLEEQLLAGLPGASFQPILDGLVATVKDPALDGGEGDYAAFRQKLRWCWDGLAQALRASLDDAGGDLAASCRELAELSIGSWVRETIGDAALGAALAEGDAQRRRFLDAGKATVAQLLTAVDVSDDPVARGTAGRRAADVWPYFLRTVPALLEAAESDPAWKELNVPFVATNRSFHAAGPALPRLRVRVTGPEPSLLFRLGQRVRLAVEGPGGAATVYQQVPWGEQPLPGAGEPVHDLLELGPETLATPGLVYELVPHAQSSLSGDDYIERANLDVMRAQDVELELEPGGKEDRLCVFAPRIFFRAPDSAAPLQVEVQVPFTWGNQGWHPSVRLQLYLQVHGVWQPHGDEQVQAVVLVSEKPEEEEPLRVSLEAPGGYHLPWCWRLGLPGRVDAPVPRERKAGEPFPQWCRIRSADGSPVHVTTHPDLFLS